jgi:beta-N-acetylhexosaminidase
MAIDEVVGQLLWAYTGTPAPERTTEMEQAARRGLIGGVYLSPFQMPGPAATAELLNRLQAAAPVPLLVGVDAEAGLGRVMAGATHLPSMMALGAIGDPALAREAAAVTATEARACGINTAFAPVLDVNVNPANPIINTRSFGSSAALKLQRVRRLRAGNAAGAAGPGAGARASPRRAGLSFPGPRHLG